MESRSRSLRKATLTLIGTIIGAGVFALPAMFARVGFWPGTILFGLLTAVVLLTHLLFVEIILSHKERQRLAGYAKDELGPVGFWIAAITYPLQIMGVNLIYLILGGEFLAAIAKLLGLGGSVQFWQILFWFAGAVTVLYGLKFVAKVEAVATWILVASMLVIILLSFNFVDRSQLSVAHWNQLLVPFGIFLFSLSGISVIAETVDLTKRKRKDAWRAVTVGTLAAAFLSWMFGVLLSLASGGQIGRNPADLIAYLPLGWGWLIPVFGFFAIATSFITTAQDLKAMLHLDFKLQKRLAWVLALFTPLILFFFYRDFLSLIDIVGTVFSAIAGILVACIAMRVLRRKPNISLVWASVIPLIVIAAYAIGMLHQFWYRPSV